MLSLDKPTRTLAAPRDALAAYQVEARLRAPGLAVPIVSGLLANNANALAFAIEYRR
ncbi:hypothetical protein [Nocardia terpenica]|uniref:hypothetical protein n=1 Tax=Nocardia terpenica TaxID=455432 RepID=UPI0002F4B8B1|nr:hypothetical protein [Nocardia terpenica]NQE86619.1 hypothetical protein [Nocardia terpenica]